MNWHVKTIEETLEKLNAAQQGLSPAESKSRLLEYGPNELKEKAKKTAITMFAGQFTDFMILILLAAAAVSGFIGELSDTIAILAIVVLNAVVGFIQEYRAEKAMEALKKMAEPSAAVLREGKPAVVPISEVVPGDIVLLEAGRIVPADMRLSEAVRLKIEEAALTGESVPVEKQTRVLYEEMLPLGDRKNMAFKGTKVSYGRGAGIVTATGMDTELGRIAGLLQEEDEAKTPLQKRLAAFGKKLAAAVIVICAIVFGFGILRGEQVMPMLLTAISLAVAAIPEALPAVVTIALALGARKMVANNVLIRKLPAVETLGSVTYICSDKTGTLTMNKMAVEELWVDGKILKGIHEKTEVVRRFMAALALSNDASAGADGRVAGDPTEVALYNAAGGNGFDKQELEKEFPRVAEIPFDPERKCMTTIHSRKEGFISFTKGAAEVLAGKSIGILSAAGVRAAGSGEIERINDKMAADGLRVLCVAMKEWKTLPENISPENVEKDMVILGLAGIMDPPREEAKEAIRMCKSAGIKSVMITGDHPITAKAIAKRLGILSNGPESVITGKELDELSESEFMERVERINVYARVAPEQKLKIVRALQEKGQFVAMTGDGVNDAPALKRADIGVAMGITGTDVAKEASHMILLDDNFATIVNAVKEGRKIYDNIRKFIRYLLATNSGEIWTLFLAPFCGLPIPLLPIQILWINLVTDSFPALALSAEPQEGDVMKRPPRHPKESFFARGLGAHAVWVGLLMACVVLSVQAWAIKTGHENWRTIVFSVLCLLQLGNALAARSERESLLKIGLFSNMYLLGSIILVFGLQLAIVYLPLFNPVFKTSPLTPNELLLTLALSTIVFIAVEIEKYFRRLKPSGSR